MCRTSAGYFRKNCLRLEVSQIMRASLRNPNFRSSPMTMTSTLIPAALALALAAGFAPAPAEAAGCLEGAAIGGAAGHVAGHHGLVGAGVGCVIGRHEANKHERERYEHEQR